MPQWLTTANVVTTLTGLRVVGDTYIGFRNAYAGRPLNEFRIDTDTISSVSRTSQICADAVTVLPDHRGTKQELRLQAGLYAQVKGGCDVNGSTALVSDVEFIKGAW
ncbi:hypothetical protein [Kitasatospora sp. LaBMicrA B282]|uniref:hypothetical protein n=1 Tax=Kitasatospora sp. LaBMicrA B282 TaxID=3420949 RepID=UPI003D0A21D1